MSTLSKTLNSGAVLNVTLADFPLGKRLFKAVTKELESLDFNEDTVAKMALRLISSDEIEEALWPCMGRVTYNSLKVTPALFEDSKIREDFLEVAKEVMVFNLTPFFASLGSILPTFAPKITESLKST